MLNCSWHSAGPKWCGIKRLTVHLAEIWVPSAEGKGKKNNFLIMAGHWAENITTTLSIKRLVPILQCVHNDWKLPYLVILLLLMCRHFNVNCTALKTHTARRHFLQRPLGGAKRAFYHLPHSHLSLFLDCLPSLSVCYKPCNSSLSLNFVAFCAKTERKKNAPLGWRCNSFVFFEGGILSFFPPPPIRWAASFRSTSIHQMMS